MKIPYIKWYAKFCLLELPFIMALYIPYNVLWLKYSGIQLEKWFITAGFMYIISSTLMSPYVKFIFKLIGNAPK